MKYKDKKNILKNSKKLKGSGSFINEDLSARVLKRHMDKQEDLKKARKEGKIAYFSLDRFIIKERSMMPSSLSQQPFGALGASGFFYSAQ